ncbi:hypothetical protein PY254_07730 [Rhodanobacter sp. AS-Z3]|uniref:hypothetical protein n=1 Tax=Rhodanobacter sp. AS-Z3 TaxID=3031330 RepID=UPI002478B4AF|nr:hypothetical protein [Rhodanobacter sp. AS-Z3]WEN16542.1 hypothetical protein PY254_07730 [Rhodanobacter sp. AS-Z3]
MLRFQLPRALHYPQRRAVWICERRPWQEISPTLYLFGWLPGVLIGGAIARARNMVATPLVAPNQISGMDDRRRTKLADKRSATNFNGDEFVRCVLFVFPGIPCS